MHRTQMIVALENFFSSACLMSIKKSAKMRLVPVIFQLAERFPGTNQ